MTRPLHTANFYETRLSDVISYIDKHLAESLPLSILSAKAAFSPNHFHKVFTDWMGETPQTYIRRCRLERAAAMLRYGTGTQVREISSKCGYRSPESFDRAFHVYFGMTPMEWRHGGHTRWNKSEQCVSESAAGFSFDQVKIKIVHSFRVIYRRKIGPYSSGEAELWDELSARMKSLNLANRDCYGIGLDDPTVTPPDRCRFDACIRLSPLASFSGSVQVKTIPGGYYGILPYRGIAGNTSNHWAWLFNEWLPKSGFGISQNSSFEHYPEGVPTIGAPVSSDLYLPLDLK